MNGHLNIGAAIGILNQETVAGTATIYSHAVDTSFSHYIGLWIKATSVLGTPDIRVQWEAGRAGAATAQAADTNFVVPNGMSDIATALINEVWNLYGVSPPPSGWGRLKVTGNAANPADTKVDAALWLQG